MTDAHPYATGGGGTVLEHRYGALLLAHLLTGDPIPGLGDGVVPRSVRFQATSVSPVDDLLVVGDTPDGGRRRLSIGVRRDPDLVRSDESSASLLAQYVQVVDGSWEDVRQGRWRLALAVASPNTAVQQLGELAEIARSVTSADEFRSAVDRPGRTNDGVRRRLGHLDDLVEAAAKKADSGSEVDPEELLWGLLTALRVIELRLEGADESDRTHAVGRLQEVTREDTAQAADHLFTRLAELGGRYAPAGVKVTETELRRDLSGFPLARSPSHPEAWEILDRLEEALRDRIRFRLSDPDDGESLQLDRTEEREELADALNAAASGPGALVVEGEPDVGKSALTLRATDELERAGGAVTSVSLRDLPPTTLEFEGRLGGELEEILAGAPTGTPRLLVVDGAEAVLEGRDRLLTEVATEALRAGLTVVAVSRTDAVDAVADAVSDASYAAGEGAAPLRHAISPLGEDEIKRVSRSFPALARLTAQPGGGWLLRRLGLVDLLLRSGSAEELSADGPLSEADVFAAVWNNLIRNGEKRTPDGIAPDAREQALIALARQLLLGDRTDARPDADALPSLRSDGLLLPSGETFAWNPGDQFASDLVRDFSVARLLITEGVEVLNEAGAPRWALRASRLACQARLARAEDTETARAELQTDFQELASGHGARWEEVPLEALLTLGSAEEALAQAWPALLEDDGAKVSTLLRLARQRYSKFGVGDIQVLAPLVKLTFCSDEGFGQDRRYTHRGIGEQVRELVLAWLKGMAMAGAGPSTLRQEVRDRILGYRPEPWDEFAVEALAMLGPDLDDSAEDFLRDLAENEQSRLHPAVESAGAVIAMAAHQPELLLTLTEAYYIEDLSERRHFSPASLLDDGIRKHRGTGPVGVPFAASYFGPFLQLLKVRPRKALALINRMLDHAATNRVRKLSGSEPIVESSDSQPTGLDLDLPGIGSRRCAGDPHVWRWYRGSGVGPYPCMSALLAVERFADQLVDDLGVPFHRIAQMLLSECHNLAMPALVVGLLVRHADDAEELLDRWLVRPEVWELEVQRVVSEGQLHAQGAAEPDLTGEERRRYRFQDVAAEMTLHALLAGDEERLEELALIGDELLRRARHQVDAGHRAEESLATVEGWVSLFDADNYRARESDDGGVLISYEPPEEITSSLEPTLETVSRSNEVLRLLAAYVDNEGRVAPVDSLEEDLTLARDLAEDPPDRGREFLKDAVAAVAAAAVVAHAEGRISLATDDQQWCATVLVEASEHPEGPRRGYEGTIHPMGADRSAAVALPTLLLPSFAELQIDLPDIRDALQRSAGSPFDEVRMAFARGTVPVWGAPCDGGEEGDLCRHEIVWAAVKHGVEDCRLGDWDPAEQRRTPEALSAPLAETLPSVETKNLLEPRLRPPLVAAAHAARSDSCIADPAGKLVSVLLKTHCRAWDHWAEEGYGGAHERRRPEVARVLVEMAVDGNPGPLTGYVRAFTSNPQALDELLRDLAILFTYDERLRGELLAVWREVMSAALDAIDDGADIMSDHHWSGNAIGRLLPTPQTRTGDTDRGSTLEHVREDWIDPDQFADLVARWIPIAHGAPEAVDAVAQLAQCAQPSWQAATGLFWIEELIDEDYGAVAGRCWFLVDWLESVRASGELDEDGTARWRRIVDELAAEGDSRAVRLQRAEE